MGFSSTENRKCITRLTWACSSYIMSWHSYLREKNILNWHNKSVFACVFVSVCHRPSDQVFGCRLEMLCEREKSTVPRFVRLCTEAVERRGTVAADMQPAPANVILNLNVDTWENNLNLVWSISHLTAVLHPAVQLRDRNHPTNIYWKMFVIARLKRAEKMSWQLPARERSKWEKMELFGNCLETMLLINI